MPKKSPVRPEVFQLKVTVLGTMPPIWRRLLVPADLTLAQLHDVLQSAMEWQDCHMHEFSAGRRRFGTPNPQDCLMGMRWWKTSARHARLGDKYSNTGPVPGTTPGET